MVLKLACFLAGIFILITNTKGLFIQHLLSNSPMETDTYHPQVAEQEPRSHR